MRPPESFLGQPIRSLQTMLQVIADAAGQECTLIPDGIYGPETMRTVAAFQRARGLPVTGITDRPTWEAVSAAYDLALAEVDAAPSLPVVWNPGQTVRAGESHPNVGLAQSMLGTLSRQYQSVSEPSRSGTLDESTADSLSSFQRLHGLPQTRQLDRKTWEALTRQYPLAATLGRKDKKL